MSKYWHIQLHPGHLEHFDEAQFNKAIDAGIIGMCRGWNNDRGVPVIFRYEVTIGDIVMVSHRGNKVLVEVISDVYENNRVQDCLLYTSPSPRDRTRSRMPSSA